MKNKLIELIKEARAEARANAMFASDFDDLIDFPTEEEYVADFFLDRGVTIGTDNNISARWIPVEERLPDPEQDVLVSCKQGEFKYQCTAFYIPPKWDAEESFYSWDSECLEYSEENDVHYVKSGWYEHIHNWDEYAAVGITDKVTHWMPLPEPPKEEA